MRCIAISLLSLLAFILSPTAYANPELSVRLITPNNAPKPDVFKRYKVDVENVGLSKARQVEVVFSLDAAVARTYPLAAVGDLHNKCTLVDSDIICAMGGIQPGQTKRRWIEVAFPLSLNPHVIVVTATANNAPVAADSAQIDLKPVRTPVTGPQSANVRHCWNNGLTSIVECDAIWTSLPDYDLVLEADGSITFLIANMDPGYAGTWQQPNTRELQFTYTYNGQLFAEFIGYGAGDGCFEGQTVYQGDTNGYYDLFEVCLP